MKKNNKILLIVLIICITVLNFILIINFTYGNMKNSGNTTTENQINITTSSINKTTTTKNPSTSQIKTTKKSTTKKTTRITTNSNIGITEEILKKMYYYYWSSEEERDYTGRNCLFLYDIDGKLIDGEVKLLYYGKYEKTQKITKDINNCFLEDMYSTEVKSIIIEGIEYEQ